MTDDKKPTKKSAREVLNGAAFIEKLAQVIESRAGRLVGAVHQPDKSWLTTERGLAIHKRLGSVIATLQAAQAVIEANIPRPKTPERSAAGLVDLLLGAGAHPAAACDNEDCPVHGPGIRERKRTAS